MKMRLLIYLAIASGIVLSACELDNYDPPTSTLKGYVMYEGEPVGVRSDAVELELWQHGYDLFTKIPVMIAQDGSYSAKLFDGDYKLVLRRGGPWVDNTDSLDVQVRGTTIVDVPVRPFYRIRNQSFKRDGAMITADFNIEEIAGEGQIDRISLFVSTTTIVDHYNQEERADLRGNAIGDLNNKQSIKLVLPEDLKDRSYVFARLGIQAAGAPELIYTPVVKLEL
jgi:hypothetical protein